MESKRMTITPLKDQVYLLNDAGESTCYVVVGPEKAMVIDTVNGEENLLDIVRTITDLPLIVVNTHGHCDHILGNSFFEEAWLHPADAELAKEHFSFKPELTPCPLRWLEIGQQFDLGGGQVLEVVSLKGHTQGSVGLLDRQRRVLFSGDGCNPHIWMQLPDSTSIAELRDTLIRLMQEHGHEFDTVLFGHAGDDQLTREIANELIAACDAMLRGETGSDPDYNYFAGVCKQHPYDPADPNKTIVYTPEKL